MSYRRYTRDEYARAMRLFAAGYGSFKVAEVTGFPRATVRNWQRLGHPPARIQTPDYTDWRPPANPEASYCYLLGLYLGDGCVVHIGPRSKRLVLTLDQRYPEIIRTASEAIEALCGGVNVCHHQRPGCIAVAASSMIWPHAFPQDGPGRKHLRRIQLTDWQSKICASHPRSLIRGLIYSDGSRVINQFSTRLPSGRLARYAYVRYFFTNYSADIRAIFGSHCDMLGIRWTQSSFKNISVSHRDSVELLDEFVGPKS